MIAEKVLSFVHLNPDDFTGARSTSDISRRKQLSVWLLRRLGYTCTDCGKILPVISDGYCSMVNKMLYDCPQGPVSKTLWTAFLRHLYTTTLLAPELIDQAYNELLARKQTNGGPKWPTSPT